jgi:hypothetical protein
MKKDAIKVVKRNKKDAAEKNQAAVADAPEVASDTRLTMVKTIKDWISERRETSRAEKVFSDDKILG